MIHAWQHDGMKMQQILLTLVGATVSIMLALVLVWYSKNSIVNTVSRRHMLQMLKSDDMSGTELVDAAKESNSATLSPKQIPVMLVKLQEEGLVQRIGNSRYVITAKGLEALESLDAMSSEFQKLGKIVQKTSTISKFLVSEAIDRLTMISGIDEGAYGHDSRGMMAAYGADEQ